MMATIDNLQFTLPLVTTIIKLVIIWWKKPDLTLILNTIANDWLKAKTDNELHVMIKRAQNARIITIFGYVIMTVGFSLLVFLPCFGTSLRYVTNITDSIKILPLQTHYFYDKNQSPYYELTFIAQTLMLVMTAASYTGVDNLLGLLVFHLCGQMENLKEQLINIRQFKNFNNGLALIVKDHFLSYFDIVESTFTFLLLGLLLYFEILIGLYGFLIVAVLTEGKEMSMLRFIYLISVALNICGHMCLYCVVGEILVAQCEGIYHAAYDYEWYMLEPEEARTLIIIMIRANKPLYITAGKMFPMTLPMFCNLIKASGGYMSVLLIDFEWATKLNRLTLSIVGIWPNIHENASDKFLSDLRAMFSVLLFVFIGMIPAMHSLVRTWGDMLAMIDNLQVTLPLVTTIMKLVIIWWKKPTLILVLNTIANDWLKSKTDKELHVMIKRAQSARAIAIFGFVLVTVGSGLLVVLPCFGTSMRYMTNITDPIKILPLQSHYFYDKNLSPYYELTFAAQTLLLILAAASYIGVDNLFGLLVFHLCGQMENLKERLINIKQFKNFNNGLSFIVKDHIRLIKFHILISLKVHLLYYYLV
ncbi:PREDICTED: odorant receptor 85c-like [Wasmannia auropunctata]|uniref:odorant receptor 85c-like n=1 Tax=Wasmannia auropunctata TaxID=64793 RepID=UPI0005EF36D1|nr:PREDICTED: odorant receptor 85c-like [Wasmannia auropunctata]